MSSLLEQALSGQPLDTEIIDMHGHIHRAAFAIPEDNAASLVASMDRLGISSTLVSPMLSWSYYTEEGNDAIARDLQEYRERIFGYAAMYPSDEKQVRAEAEKRMTEGFIGFKFHNTNGFPYSDPAYGPAYRIAEERKLPMLFHTWGHEHEFENLGRIAEEHPNASLLLGHTGSNYLDGYIAFSQKHPNVYLELALSTAPRGLVTELVAKGGADKVVWGSDCLFLNQAQQLGRVIGADISDEDKKKIIGGNARKILDRIVS